MLAGNNMAQYSNNNSKLNWIDNMHDNAPHLYRSYKTGSTLSGVGMGLTIGGLAASVIGIATADKETTSTSTGTQVNLSGSGGVVFAVGVVCIVTGTPIWIIGNIKKRNVKRTYLRDYGNTSMVPNTHSPYLKLNSTTNSIGLSLVF